LEYLFLAFTGKPELENCLKSWALINNVNCFASEQAPSRVKPYRKPKNSANNCETYDRLTMNLDPLITTSVTNRKALTIDLCNEP